jgi:allophanate hydrolase
VRGAERAPLTIAALRAAYDAGKTTPRETVERVYAHTAALGATATWISRVPLEEALARAAELEERRGRGESLPLYGVPFAAKDNIDAAALPTTAACPAFAYQPAEDSAVVARLLAAGAILVGKTNLDQFATGLVGTRSPHGAPRCVFNHEYISGGSSSGSAVAVALGEVSFSLGTDTAGSGRVPASFNDLVGLKPTRGRVSTRGVVPACASLDCVTVFARDCAGALTVLQVMEGYDPRDPYSRPSPAEEKEPSDRFWFGIPSAAELRFFGDAESPALYRAALERLVALGGTPVEIDFAPFRETAELLYGGPWVAERDAEVGDFLRANPTASDPVVRSIILGAARYSATDAFRALHRLEALRRQTAEVWEQIDLLALPTTGTIYTVEQLRAEPYTLNANLGHYTNFTNLLDLCAVALPAGFRENRTPFGITLHSPAFEEGFLCDIGMRYESLYRKGVEEPLLELEPRERAVSVAVVGAHLSGQPLNHQLTGRGGRLARSCRTAPVYRLYALAGSTPPKPGLVHAGADGASIEVEVWELGEAAFGSFVAEVPAPLAIGTVELEDGTSVKGFVCEPRATAGAADITRYGGWRAYRADTT